jgi:hypothetical protein
MNEIIKKPWYKRWYGITGIIIVLLLIISNMGSSKTPTTSSTTSKEPAVQTSTTKTYHQVFSFSGNGIKKSEPFTVTGDRFKIKYDCKGDMCQAYMYKLDSKIPTVIMNTAGSTKDETIAYGSGEYYIEANTMGSFTMSVEDYN